MRILQISKQVPFPPKDGYSIAVSYIAKSLIDNDCEVELLAMNTTKHFVNLEYLPTNFNEYAAIHTVTVDNRITAWGAFKNLFSAESFMLSRFNTPAFEAKLVAILEEKQYDIIQLESVQLSSYIPTIRQYSNAKIAMRAHNVEFEIWERHVATTPFLLKKWYLQSQLSPFRQFEIEQLKNYDIMVAITQKDLEGFQQLGFEKKGIVIPVGIDANNYQANHFNPDKPITVSFIGSLDWMPNQEGVRWFLEKVWPKMVEKFPTAQFHIAGRHAPNWLKKQANKNVVFEGEVAHAIDFIKQHPIMVVPLFSGSGIRVKILEGMALNRVILTTNLGMEGIDAQHAKEILIADKASDFIQELERCFTQPNQLQAIGQHAKAFIHQFFANKELGKKLKSCYEND